jgi:hypothetical protein
MTPNRMGWMAIPPKELASRLRAYLENKAPRTDLRGVTSRGKFLPPPRLWRIRPQPQESLAHQRFAYRRGRLTSTVGAR